MPDDGDGGCLVITFAELRDTSPVHGWTTRDEEHYLAHLGRWAHPHARKSETHRLELLQSYRIGMLRRAVWGDVEPGAVLERVTQEIQFEEARLGMSPA
jgi:hypothetical protein